MKSISRLRRANSMALVAIALCLAVVPTVQAMKIKNQNLTQLITDSQDIVFGTVTRVSDGFNDKGVPYTEVTIAVGSAAKGKVEAESDYTFRQFGLLKPRNMGNGKIYLGVSPEGFPRWIEGETVVAFMRAPASITGLQTTAGMGQGKLSLVNGKLINEYNNFGMFDGVHVSADISDEQRSMITNPGEINAANFIDLVGRAVNEQWIEKGVME